MHQETRSWPSNDLSVYYYICIFLNDQQNRQLDPLVKELVMELENSLGRTIY